MSEPDEHDRKAAELLPCTCSVMYPHSGRGVGEHSSLCPGYNRAEVATALRAAYQSGLEAAAKIVIRRESIYAEDIAQQIRTLKEQPNVNSDTAQS